MAYSLLPYFLYHTRIDYSPNATKEFSRLRRTFSKEMVLKQDFFKYCVTVKVYTALPLNMFSI